MAAVSHTTPSHATMLTGLVPAVHGVVNNGDRLDPGALDLARVFEQAGYRTGAFLNVEFLQGLSGSFEHVDVRKVLPVNGKKLMLTGKDVVDAALAWLEKERGERFFLWVHLYDPHKWKDLALERGLDGPSAWAEETPADFYSTIAALHGLPAWEPGQPFHLDWKVETKPGESIETKSAEEYLRCIDAYDALTLFADQQVERLYRELEGFGLPGRTLWVVTADHGEGLGSHRIAGHGSRIYQEQLRVPLIVHASDGSLAARRIRAPVGLVDLFATLVQTLGMEAVGAGGVYDGRSLWPLIRGEAETLGARPLFAQRRPLEQPDQPDSRLYSLQDGRYKYILHEPGKDEFFDLEEDPLELADRSGNDVPEARELRRLLEERLKVLEQTVPASAGSGVPEEWAEELRDLGYAR